MKANRVHPLNHGKKKTSAKLSFSPLNARQWPIEKSSNIRFSAQLCEFTSTLPVQPRGFRSSSNSFTCPKLLHFFVPSVPSSWLGLKNKKISFPLFGEVFLFVSPNHELGTDGTETKTWRSFDNVKLFEELLKPLSGTGSVEVNS